MITKPAPLLFLAGAVFAAGMVAAACGNDGGGTAVARSDLKRTTSPAVSTTQRAELRDGNTEFALDLYGALSTKEGNLFLSPHSISVALAMTYAGARGETATEMADTLHFTVPGEALHAAFNALDLDIAMRPRVKVQGEGTPPELSVANSTWGEQSKTFLDEFLDVLAFHYDAGMRLVDFRTHPEAARVAINRWVEEKTKERIKNLIPEGMISPATSLVLANAIYFKGSWETPFVASDTAKGPFTLSDGATVDVPLMHLDIEARYAEVAGTQAVELRYVGNEVAMVVMLPAPGKFDAFEAELDGELMARLDASWADALVRLAFPKFEFESEFVLNDVLRELGMVSAFDGRADFSGMDGERSLFISAVVHKAFVAVDEKGTEAAAATAVIMDESAPMKTATMTVDRPFVFFIRDIPTGAILFLGRVVDPR